MEMFQLVNNRHSITQEKKSCFYNNHNLNPKHTSSPKSKILNYSWTEVKVNTNTRSTCKMNAAQHKNTMFCTRQMVFELRICSSINLRMTKASISVPSPLSETGLPPLDRSREGEEPFPSMHPTTAAC